MMMNEIIFDVALLLFIQYENEQEILKAGKILLKKGSGLIFVSATLMYSKMH
jgi:hypothetical protein